MGSGPFLFLREQWVPGERVVFRRNPAYVPRDKPADGLAGGKVARAEQVEFVNMGDPGLRAAALRAAALVRTETLAAHGLPADMVKPDCLSMFMCGGTAYSTEGGAEIIRNPSVATAKELLRQAGYKGEPVVWLQPSDSALINPLGLV